MFGDLIQFKALAIVSKTTLYKIPSDETIDNSQIEQFSL